MAVLKDNYQGSPPPSADVVCDAIADWAGQTFTASSTYTVTTLKLFLKKDSGGNCGTITASIKAVNVGTGKPEGGDLASGTYAGASLSTNYGWITFDLGAGVELTEGTDYAVVVRADAAGVSPNRLLVAIDSAPVYEGERFFSTNSGGAWNGPFTSDLFFEAYAEGVYADMAGTGGGIGGGSAALGKTNMADMIATGGGTGGGSAALLVSGFPASKAGTSFIYKRLVVAGNDKIYYEDI